MKTDKDTEKRVFNYEKMYTFMKGFAMGANMPETLKALAYAREKHKGQTRKGGEPYIVHPLTMACNAVAMNIVDDNIIAVILLHDVVEDCGVRVDELPVNDIVKKGVKQLTFNLLEGETKEEAKKRYYNLMLESKEATIAKLIDRCHNVSTMAGVFSQAKLDEYIEETKNFVMPLMRKAKDKYPEMSNIFFSLKYHITSVVNAVEATLNVEQ